MMVYWPMTHPGPHVNLRCTYTVRAYSPRTHQHQLKSIFRRRYWTVGLGRCSDPDGRFIRLSSQIGRQLCSSESDTALAFWTTWNKTFPAAVWDSSKWPSKSITWLFQPFHTRFPNDVSLNLTSDSECMADVHVYLHLSWLYVQTARQHCVV